MADNVDARENKMGIQAEASVRASQANISDRVSDSYKMDHGKRGMAVIINNRDFHPQTMMGVRNGTNVDADSMYELLDNLGFESINQHDNKTAADIRDILLKASKVDHSRSDCFVCVLLSHGEEGVVYGVDKKIDVDDLVRPFKGNNCPSLAGKPKLFFIQYAPDEIQRNMPGACRGSKLDVGQTVADAAGQDDTEIYRIPTEADFLMAYSTVPGFYSWRNSVRGSWFITALVEVFKKHWKTMDVLTMMTRVNKKVAMDFESRSSEERMSQKKQTPCITSMLTKDVYFFKHV